MGEEYIYPPNFENEEVPQFLNGYFLISETELIDPNFYRTVVLIIEHNEDGAFGLVVTRKTETTMGELIEDLGDEIADQTVYMGGPVQRNLLFAVHSELPESFRGEFAKTPAPGVVFEPVTEGFIEFIRTELPGLPEEDRPEIRFYAGYSGWGGGQLENELKVGAWFIHKASPDIVFHPKPEQGWKDALSKKGTLYQIIAETGYKPSKN